MLLPRSTYRIIGAASFGLAALVLGGGAVLALGAGNSLSDSPSNWLLALAATALGAGVGATEAPRIAAEPGLGVVRVTVVGSLAALVVFAVVVAIEAALGASGVVDSLVAAQETFAGAIGAGLVCGSVLYLPVLLLWGAVGAVMFRWARRRVEARAV